MGRIILFLTGLGALAMLASCSEPRVASTPLPSPSVPPAAVRADANQLKGTIVTGDLSQPIEKGTNIVWCASFQLAWNELMELNGGPIQLDGAPPLAVALNKRVVTRKDLDANSVVAVAGVVGEGVLRKAREELARQFGGQAAPGLLPGEGRLPDFAVVAYAYLWRALPFEIEFARRSGMRFGPRAAPEDANDPLPRVDYFGIEEYLPGNALLEKRAGQVRVLWHEYVSWGSDEPPQERFVVELQTAVRDDRLILAKIEPGRDLDETVGWVLSRAAAPNAVGYEEGAKAFAAMVQMYDRSDGTGPTEEQIAPLRQKVSGCLHMLPRESLSVPVLDFDVVKSFASLYGRRVTSANPKLNGLPIGDARQQIRFRLDEKGAVLASEASIQLFGIGPRRFDFCEPFLLLLIHKGASKPYFALWVGNAELLAASPPSAGT